MTFKKLTAWSLGVGIVLIATVAIVLAVAPFLVGESSGLPR